MRLHRALTPLLLVLLLAMLSAGPAAAHTELESAVPEDGGTVADPPIEVVLTFTQPLADPEAAQVEVIDPAGDDLVSAPPTVEAEVVTVPLNLAVAEGVHEVRWVVIAQDGHRLEGTTTFTFAPPAEVATPSATASPTAGATPLTRPTSTATPSESAALPSPPPPTPEPAPTGSEAVSSTSDGGISPAVGIVLAALALAAVGAVIVMRVRRGDDGLG